MSRTTPDAPAFNSAEEADRCLEPLSAISCEAARQNKKDNRYSTWASREFAANQREPDHASQRIWKALPELGIDPKFRISVHDKVFAMGSCFAREVEDALVDLAFDVPTYCDALFDHPLLQSKNAAPAARPRAYLNRYNTMSLEQEIRHLLGVNPDIEQGAITYAVDKRAVAELHYTQSLPQATLEDTLERRRIVRAYLGDKLRQCSVFIFTLGMAECWYDTAAQRYLNNTPGPRVMAAFGDRLELHLTRFSQHLQAIERAFELLVQTLGRHIRVVITVSPVPLELSMQASDVVRTNLYSKSMLRAVAEEFAANHPEVDYFPSYEFVSVAAPEASWAWDYRHVKPALVAHIMKAFQTHYVAD